MNYEIELTNWKEDLKNNNWHKKLKDKIKNKEIISCGCYEKNNLSNKLYNTLRRFENLITDEEQMEYLISWLNYYIGNHFIEPPCDDTIDYWLKINDNDLCITFKDEYEKRRNISFGIGITFLDAKPNENFWLDFFNHLIKEIEKHSTTEDFYLENWR